jgi:hypothetical protein
MEISGRSGMAEFGEVCLDSGHEQLVTTIGSPPGHRRVPQPRRISHGMFHHVFHRWIGGMVVDVEFWSVNRDTGDNVFSGETNEGLFMGRQEVDGHV